MSSDSRHCPNCKGQKVELLWGDKWGCYGCGYAWWIIN